MLSPVPFWSKIPFFRLVLPLAGGILIQWNCKFSFLSIYCAGAASLALFLSKQFFSLATVFRYGWVGGIAVNTLFSSIGAFLTYHADVRNHKTWIGHYAKEHSFVIARLAEPLVEKENSFKANAEVSYVINDGRLIRTSGTIILYFKKDASAGKLHYASVILVNRPLQEIHNNGNPGSFDYRQYCLFNGITHQVYLTAKDYTLLPESFVHKTWGDCLDAFLITARAKTIAVLRKNISSKKELGLGEALLIGFKDDLDKGLIQSYTNTGVVHIIAISGQHLALIYWLLLQLLSPLKKSKRLRWLNTIIILSVLWLFSLMTGAQPSIMRAALMCTIMLLAEVFSRRSNTLNSLACSAFVLLCVNPFDLWDVGFQLSYLGLISLVLFTRPIYTLVYISNKALDYIWQLVSASVAAQILTAPISIYHFHQFPFSFILTNLVAVPLSSLILIGELLLFVVSVIPLVALVTGKLVAVLIWLMNTWVERLEGLKLLLWDGLQITWLQTLLLYLSILGFSIWLLNEVKRFVWIGVGGIVLFLLLRSYAFRLAKQQRLFLVYNVSKHSAVDIVDGRHFYFIGDSDLMQDGFLKNFNIKPARILLREKAVQYLGEIGMISFEWYSKRIVVTNDMNTIDTSKLIDVMILSKGISSVRNFSFHFIKEVVLDGSIPQWKAKQLKEQLNLSHIPFHDVTTNGAFILNLK